MRAVFNTDIRRPYLHFTTGSDKKKKYNLDIYKDTWNLFWLLSNHEGDDRE